MFWNILQPIIGPIIEKLVDRIPNPNERAKAKEQFEMELMQAVTNASTQQNKINEIEAAHKSVFVAGWRPFIGWICGIGLFWAFVLQPMTAWAFAAFIPNFPAPPQIHTDNLYQLVLAMLGMGGLRTFEKMRGVSRETSPIGSGKQE